MKTPHKHAELIKAWADGAEIEKQNRDGTWVKHQDEWPWFNDWTYRIKPEPKHKVKRWQWIIKNSLFPETYFIPPELMTEAAAIKAYGLNVIKKLEHTEFEEEVL